MKNIFLQKENLMGQLLYSCLQPRYKVEAGSKVISVLATVSSSLSLSHDFD